MAHSGDLVDCDAATSRSSAKRVAGVVSKFCQLKQELVRAIGFGGILHMPQINKTPRKFTVWLLSKVDLASKSIVVNGVCKVKLTDKAFKRVLGIPCGPKKLVGLETNEVQDKLDFIKLALGSITTDPLETCSLKVADDIITMEYKDRMNIEQVARFKVAFVVFVVGHFLVAKTRTNHGMEEFWGSLLNTDEINQHNFCSMVIDEILESVRKVQEALRLNHTIKNVTGCTLGLQVLYLDSLNLSGFELATERVPRLPLFDLQLLKKMINADQENNISYCQYGTSVKLNKQGISREKRVCFESDRFMSTGTSSKEANKSAFRTPQPAVSTYLTAYLRGSIEQKLTYGQVDALKWHNARMIHHIRKSKETISNCGGLQLNGDGFKSMVEVQMEDLMSKVFQDNLSLAQRLHSHASSDKTPTQQFPKWSSSLNLSSNYYGNTSNGHSSVGGFSVTESDNSNKVLSDKGKLFTPILGKQLFLEEDTCSRKKIKQELGSSSTSKKNDNVEVQPACDTFILSEDAITAITENCSNIWSKGPHVLPLGCAFKKLKCSHRNFAPNPWRMGVKRMVVATQVANDLFLWLQHNNLSTLRSSWIVHALPKYIELDGYLLKSIFIKKTASTADAFDIAIRRIIQLDSNMYGRGRKMSWRHIMESDFALIIPSIVNLSWCAYFWDMEERKVHVIDPMNSTEIDGSIEDIHRCNIIKIQYCLSKIIDLLFDGWKVNWKEFKPNFVKPLIPSPGRGADGLLTLLAIQEFDGSSFVEPPTEETIHEFSKVVLYEMVSLEGNYGKIPKGYIHSIN